MGCGLVGRTAFSSGIQFDGSAACRPKGSFKNTCLALKSLYNVKNKPFLSLQELNIIAWIVAFIIGYLVVYGLNLPESYAGILPSKAVNAAYGGFHRLAWGIAISWVIFACCRGYGGKKIFGDIVFEECPSWERNSDIFDYISFSLKCSTSVSQPPPCFSGHRNFCCICRIKKYT